MYLYFNDFTSRAFHVKLYWNEWHRALFIIDSGNGLVSSGNKPTPEPMLTKFYDIRRGQELIYMRSWWQFWNMLINANTHLKIYGSGNGWVLIKTYEYRKVSNIRRTKCQNLNYSRLVLQLSVPNPLKPSVKSIMKM